MNTSRSWLTGLLVVGLLAALTVGLAGLLNRGAATEQMAQGGLAAPEQQALTPTLQAAIVFGGSDATWTPIPTFTPQPTLTPISDSTSTPYPIPEPANDSSGLLVYSIYTDQHANGNELSMSGEIHQTQIDAGGRTGATSFIRDGWMKSYPSWDHRLVALVNSTMGGDRVYILNPATDEIIEVKRSFDLYGFFAGWHPNGREILFLVDRSVSGGLWFINIISGEYRVIMQQDPLYITSASSSPDGQYVAFSQQRDWRSPGELWIEPTNRGEARQIYSGGALFGVTWSPDNTKIAFVDRANGLMMISPDGNDSQVASTHFHFGYGFTPMWSPDGSYLAFVAANYDPRDPVEEFPDSDQTAMDKNREAFVGSTIHIIELSTMKEQPLIPFEFFQTDEGAIDPAFSPDGKLIAFAALRGGLASLWISDLSGEFLEQAIEATYLVRYPSWVR